MRCPDTELTALFECRPIWREMGAEQLFGFKQEIADETRCIFIDQFSGGSHRDNSAVIEDHDAITEHLGLMHIVGSYQNGLTVVSIPDYPFPNQVSDRWVQTGGWFVEN